MIVLLRARGGRAHSRLSMQNSPDTSSCHEAVGSHLLLSQLLHAMCRTHQAPLMVRHRCSCHCSLELLVPSAALSVYVSSTSRLLDARPERDVQTAPALKVVSTSAPHHTRFYAAVVRAP